MPKPPRDRQEMVRGEVRDEPDENIALSGEESERYRMAGNGVRGKVRFLGDVRRGEPFPESGHCAETGGKQP